MIKALKVLFIFPLPRQETTIPEKSVHPRLVVVDEPPAVERIPRRRDEAGHDVINTHFPTFSNVLSAETPYQPHKGRVFLEV